MNPMRPTRLLLLLSLLVTTALLVATGWLLPELPAGEGIYASAAVTVLLGGLMIGSYAHFLNLTRWDTLGLRPDSRVPRPALAGLLLALVCGLALLWPMLRSREPVVAASAGQYLHFDASEANAETGADDYSPGMRVKFTSGRQ
jgi:hypothetical protein